MRKVLAILSLAAALTASTARAESEDLKGSDWTQMDATQKELFVYTAIGALEQDGVVITRPSVSYVEALDKLLSMDASYQGEYLDNLFVFAIYEHEPQARERIDEIKRQKIREAALSGSSGKTS